MLEETTIRGEKIEVLSNGCLQVRDAVVIVRDGQIDTSFPAKYHRYVLHPGDDLTGKPAKVAAIAGVVWTEEVVQAWQAASSARLNKPPEDGRGRHPLKFSFP